MQVDISDETIVQGLVSRMNLKTLQRVQSFIQDRINYFNDLSTISLSHLERKLASENKISCIKSIRERTGLGLRESKWLMDNYLDSL